MSADARRLLSIIELGGYPDFTALYTAAGYDVRIERSVRKALSQLRAWRPDVVVSEFRYNPTYGAQLGNLESIMAGLQRHTPEARLIVLHDKERRAALEQLGQRFPVHAALHFPLEADQLRRALEGIDRSGAGGIATPG